MDTFSKSHATTEDDNNDKGICLYLISRDTPTVKGSMETIPPKQNTSQQKPEKINY